MEMAILYKMYVSWWSGKKAFLTEQLSRKIA